MNKALTSLNTFFLVLLFLSLIFSIYSIPKLNIDETQSIRVNFYELIQEEDLLFDSSFPKTTVKKETKKTSATDEKIKAAEAAIVSKFKINKSDIKNEISKIKLSKEREDILRVSAIIQARISSIWIKPNSLSESLIAKVSINLAPSGELLNFDLIEPSINSSFNNSILTAMNKMTFFEEVLSLDRKLFEQNFRNFNLVFKSSGEIE
ncbi:MAG: TonB C-terminal domain-containing protein [SAR86 cluster bacterium]|uniref:TonB C-terminal domain-containing protein n=1 Tax=SAR86 cluster bacterium TaxID=2030880 RepID=A0A937LCH0_9GAMM|nr:TonB C-terminal domain-containing protein [SAR86 cluster bacterium]